MLFTFCTLTLCGMSYYFFLVCFGLQWLDLYHYERRNYLDESIPPNITFFLSSPSLKITFKWTIFTELTDITEKSLKVKALSVCHCLSSWTQLASSFYSILLFYSFLPNGMIVYEALAWHLQSTRTNAAATQKTQDERLFFFFKQTLLVKC